MFRLSSERQGWEELFCAITRPNPFFSQGERAEALFYVRKGRVKLIVSSNQGKEAVVALLGPGDFLARDA
jgi:CRP/FNR family cyclic AMP-dependent transcriptional regulator